MKPLPVVVLCLTSLASHAAQLNIATLSCDKYENEIVGSPAASPAAGSTGQLDAINTVMWLFGYAMGKAGEHVMYGDALTSFGFALDAECRNNPSASLLEALGTVRPKRDTPMDLMTLNCAAFQARHADSMRSDPESADTILMWLFGYSVAQTGGHVFDSNGLDPFAATLKARCTQHPEESLYDTLAGDKGAPRH